jgi:hypothetical protein
MIATQTKALLVDAYRELNARKIFWVVLILTVVVVAAFGTLGVKGNRLSILAWELPQDIPMALVLYKWIFSYFVVGGWFTWVATILALISTASIFPEFVAGGTIDLYLSKPIGRLRLFATKYLTGLLFVVLQVTVFAVGSFLVLGLRAGVWEWGLFLAIPIVVLFFSYLFSICVLFGVLTRSTLTAFFLTLVAWFLIWGLNRTDSFLNRIDDFYQDRARVAEQQVARLDRQIADLQARLKPAPTPPGLQDQFVPDDSHSASAPELQRLRALRDRAAEKTTDTKPPSQLIVAQRIAFICNTLVPKTQDTIGLLDRVLFTDADIKETTTPPSDESARRRRGPPMLAFLHTRSLGWILGSSLVFEFVLLGLASWRFCRRDY